MLNLCASPYATAAPTFVTTTDWLSVPEGGTSVFQVKLSEQPSATVIASVSRVSGDGDISVQSGSTLTFTSTNWDSYQNVMLRAAEDEDANNSQSVFALFRTSGPTIPQRQITAVEQDNDELKFILSPEALVIPEGATAALQIKLGARPLDSVTAEIRWNGGDEDIRLISSSSLTFTPDDWNVYQSVIFEATEDVDITHDLGRFLIQVVSGPAIPTLQFTVTEFDKDPLFYVTNPQIVDVPEGATAALQIKLSVAPATPITVSIEIIRGDSDIQIVSGSTMVFNAANWNEYQTVILRAREDDDYIDGAATIWIHSDMSHLIPDLEVTAREYDNDALCFFTVPSTLSVPEGATAELLVRLGAYTPNPVTAEVKWFSGDTDIRLVTDTLLVFDSSNWNQYQSVIFTADRDENKLNDGARFHIRTVQGFPVPTLTILVTEDDVDNPHFVVSPQTVRITEGMSADIEIKLSTRPSDPFHIIPTWLIEHEDFSITAGSSLTFNETNWNVAQIIRIRAEMDNDITNEQATLIIRSASHPLTPDVQITVISQDVTQWIVVTDLVLTVNGVSETEASASTLGIGNRIDAASAIFEIGPGDRLAIDATITTFENEPPDTILLDLSDLYPPGLHSVVDEIVPTATKITSVGNVHARWEHIVFDYKGVGPLAAGLGSHASRWFADQGVLRGNLANEKDRRFNGNFAEAIPANHVDPIGATGAMGSHGVSLPESLNALQGLPFIQVQDGAIAKHVACVTVFLDDVDSQSIPVQAISAKFAVDSSPPQVSYTFPSERIIRKLPPTHTFTNPASPRIGFPSAPNLAGIESVPNRVRAGDVVSIVVDVTNSRIDGRGNDEFRQLPGDRLSFFRIDAQPSLLSVSADLSHFATSVHNAVVPAVDFMSPHSLEIISQPGKPSLIKATFSVTVEDNVGTTATAAKTPCSVTVTVMDDAGNRPYNTIYDPTRQRKIGHALSVDNRGPTVGGNIQVVLVSGSAKTPSGLTLGPNSNIPAGSLLPAGSVVRITASITDSIDSPLDILYNPNYGAITLGAAGVNIPPSHVKLEYNYVELIGADTIYVPFVVHLPTLEESESAASFRFVISATDTLGNSEAKESNSSYGFDAKPSIAYRINGVNLSKTDSRQINYNTGTEPLRIDAIGFDVNGVTSVQWDVTPLSLPGVILSTSPETFDFTRIDSSAPNTLDYTLLIQSSLLAAATTPIHATAVAIDNQNHVTIGDTLTISLNHPALFDEHFEAHVLPTGSIVPDITQIISSTSGLQLYFNEDIRHVTMPEGAQLLVSIKSSDMDGDPIILEATGSAVTDATTDYELLPRSDSFLDFRFQPGYRALIGYATSATYTLDLSAQDVTNVGNKKHEWCDHSSIHIHVTPRASVPQVEVVSIKLNNASRPSSLLEPVEMGEGGRLQIILKATDEGMDDLIFSATNSLSLPFDYSVVNASGTITATITYRAGSNFPDSAIRNEKQVSILFSFHFKNIPLTSEPVTTTVTKEVIVLLTSKPPQITTQVRINDLSPQSIDDGGAVQAKPGDTITFLFHSTDPDGDTVLMPEIDVTAGEQFSYIYKPVDLQPSSIDMELTLYIPSFVDNAESTVILIFTAVDVTGVKNQDTYLVRIRPSVQTDPDEIIVSAGHGGGAEVVVRNVSPNAAIPINGVLRGFKGAPLAYLQKIGGGTTRAAYVSAGDVNEDGKTDIVVTFGPVESDASLPNVVIVRDGVSKEIIGHPFSAFPKGNSNRAVEYNHGELRSAVGNFMRSRGTHIAVAQGIFGNQLIRFFQPTGFPSPFGYILEGQIMGLEGNDRIQNASGGITLAAGDLDNDGLDELIVGQTYSRSSQTAFQILDIAYNSNTAMAEVSRRATGMFGFAQNHFRGNGGIQPVIADLNGDGIKEIVVAGCGDDRHRANRADQPINLIGVLKPVVEQGVVKGVEYPTGYVLNVFPDSINPSGALSMAAGEFDGISSNGDELVIGTGSLIRADGFEVESVSPAPQNKYLLIKIDYDGNTVRGWSTVIPPFGSPITPKSGVNAFVGGYAPPSGALFVAAGNTD
jgi:hypothetical protein